MALPVNIFIEFAGPDAAVVETYCSAVQRNQQDCVYMLRKQLGLP